MIDRTTKLLLFAIALGLWIHLASGLARPMLVQAQGLSLGESLKVDEIAKELKKISGDTEAMRNTLNQIWATNGRKP